MFFKITFYLFKNVFQNKLLLIFYFYLLCKCILQNKFKFYTISWWVQWQNPKSFLCLDFFVIYLLFYIFYNKMIILLHENMYKNTHVYKTTHNTVTSFKIYMKTGHFLLILCVAFQSSRFVFPTLYITYAYQHIHIFNKKIES